MVRPKRQMNFSSELSKSLIHARVVRDCTLRSIRDFFRLAEEASLNS